MSREGECHGAWRDFLVSEVSVQDIAEIIQVGLSSVRKKRGVSSQYFQFRIAVCDVRHHGHAARFDDVMKNDHGATAGTSRPDFSPSANDSA